MTETKRSTEVVGTETQNISDNGDYPQKSIPYRSLTMNRCLHKALTEISADLESQGIQRRTIIEDLEGYEAPITMEWMKEVYRTIVYTMYRKTSTTDLSNKEMIDSWEVFSKFLSEQYGVSYTWPSESAQYWENYENK